MGLNAFLPSVIGSVTLSLALRHSFEIDSNHVASLGTLHHFIFPFFVRHLRLIRILIQRTGLNIFFMQVRWSPQVQLVSRASCSTCNSEYFPSISLQVYILVRVRVSRHFEYATVTVGFRVFSLNNRFASKC